MTDQEQYQRYRHELTRAVEYAKEWANPGSYHQVLADRMISFFPPLSKPEQKAACDFLDTQDNQLKIELSTRILKEGSLARVVVSMAILHRKILEQAWDTGKLDRTYHAIKKMREDEALMFIEGVSQGGEDEKPFVSKAIWRSSVEYTASLMEKYPQLAGGMSEQARQALSNNLGNVEESAIIRRHLLTAVSQKSIDDETKAVNKPKM